MEIIICKGSLVFDRSMIQIMAFYINFEGTKNIYVLIRALGDTGGSTLWFGIFDRDMLISV